MLQTQPHRRWRGGWLALVMVTLGLAFPLLTDAGALSIRVLLHQNLSTVQVAIPPYYTIVTRPENLLPPRAPRWRTLELQARHNRIRVPSMGLDLHEIRFTPLTKEAILLAAGKLYRGDLEVKARDGGLMVINAVDLEAYLYGVLPQEAPVHWEMAALRAQAIVARTYALYKRQWPRDSAYDLSAQYVHDQRYDGYIAEHPRTTQAVEETRGLVLTCSGALFPAFYHAESAGHTENSEDVWATAYPCLRAVKAQVYPISPHLQWSATLSLEEIRAGLERRGYSLGTIRRLEPLQRSATGRIMLLKIAHATGETVVRGLDFRLALGPEVIRSTQFNVDVQQGRALFSGQGWGHGVGLCQWCSQAMAELGYDHETILKHYYQGAELRRYQ